MYSVRQADKFASVRVAYDAEAETIRVTVDAQGSGFFQSCVSEKVQLPAEWWKTATVGVSASTGQVADNHDLISVETWLGVAEVPEQPEQQLTAREEEERLAALLAAERVEAGKLDPSEKALFAIVSELATQQEREVAKLKRELEHSLAGGGRRGLTGSHRRQHQHDDPQAAEARRCVGGEDLGVGGGSEAQCDLIGLRTDREQVTAGRG